MQEQRSSSVEGGATAHPPGTHRMSQSRWCEDAVNTDKTTHTIKPPLHREGPALTDAGQA